MASRASSIASRIADHLAQLYPPSVVEQTLPALLAVAERHRRSDRRPPLDERDVWLIAYADHLHDGDSQPLSAMRAALDGPLSAVARGVHLLPFYPSTSDDGFAVLDHRLVDPAIGDWAGISAIADGRRLMVDGVVNHMSASASHVKEWTGHVLEPDAAFDVGQVTRPRTSPLFTAFGRPDGLVRYAWTTFSADQVDLDYANPEVLVDMTDVLLGYLDRGASAIRLDAVGFLWKSSGTTCLHLPQTHEIVRLWRTLVDWCAPGALLVTEANVPDEENVAYFGDGHDEANLVYQFAMPPLVLAAFTWGNAQELTRWAAALEDAPGEATSFNLLGSHDGIGLRAAEGQLSEAEVEGLCMLARGTGGGVSYRATPDGRQVPYELNTTYIEALVGVADDEHGLARVLGAHAILLAFRGVPGVWLGSLLGEGNWVEGAEASGRLRSVNRRRLTLDQVRAIAEDPATPAGAVFAGLSRLIGLRTGSPAFSPGSPQHVVAGPPWLFGVRRGAGGDANLVLVSVSDRSQSVVPSDLACGGASTAGDWQDRSSVEQPVHAHGEALVLPPYGLAWLSRP